MRVKSLTWAGRVVRMFHKSQTEFWKAVLDKEGTLESRVIYGNMKCGSMGSGCSRRRISEQRQSRGVVGGRRKKAMARKQAEEP
jgi:hypothetical protein